MKNDSSQTISAWFDVSNNFEDERSWIRKYVEFDRTQRILTFYSNDCIHVTKPAPIVDLNSEMISLSSSATSSSSSSSLYVSSHSSNVNLGRSSASVLRPSHMLQSLSEYVSPSLSKAFFTSSSSSSSSTTTTINDDKTATLTPLNNNPIQSNSIRHASFTDSLSDRLSSITTTTTPAASSTNRQSKTKFSYFFGRSSGNNKSQQIQPSLPSPNISIDSLKRTKSVTKLERQKRLQQPLTTNHQHPSTSPSLHNIPSSRSRSHESLFALNGGPGNGPLGSLTSNSSTSPQLFLDNCHLRRLHPSLIQTSNSENNNDEHFSSCQYIEIREKNQKKNFYLRSKQYTNDCSILFNNLRQTSFETSTMIRGLRTDNSLDIWILEAKGFPAKKKYYGKIFLDEDIYGKTTSKERREILFWGENFTFKDLPEGCSKLRCKIYREVERRKQKQSNGQENDLIGYVDIPLSTISGNQFIEQWYPLQIPLGSTVTGKDKSQRLQDGSFNIRIKAKYQAIDILPLDSYSHLQEYIRRDYLRLIRILEPHISLRDKDEMATSLTRIAQSLGFSTSFLVDIVQAEIQSTPDNTLTFRGNSIATKSMEAYMKLIGETYLRETLTRFVTEIVSSKNLNETMDLEVDPGRVSNLQNLERNQLTLRLLCEKIWLEIQQSHSLFPQELKCIFWKLRQLSSSDETMFNLISGSVFLRFLCPAILSPNLFGLTQEYPNEKSSRKLTLIAKTLQTLANFSKFGPKESYMKFMNDFIGKESDNMRRFLANISTIDHNYDEPRLSHRSISDDKCDIDLGREYSILHSTLADLFEQIDLNTRRSLNELEFVLNELTNVKGFYSSKPNGTQIHLHHHHHHIYHHSSIPSEHFYDQRSSPYSSQISLALTGTGTTNGSSQGYHSISTSPTTITNVESLNKENLRTPLSFRNPLFNDPIRNHQSIPTDSSSSSSSDDDDDDEQQQQLKPTDSSKALYFVNSLCIESQRDSSSPPQPLVHSASRQSLQQQQPLFVLNNGYMTRSTQSLASSTANHLPSTTYYCVKTSEDFNGMTKRQSILPSHQGPPKMGIKALSHSTSNKDLGLSQRSPILNLYQEEKYRRIESEKQTERLRLELTRSQEEIEEYRQYFHLINDGNLRTNVDDLPAIDFSDEENSTIEKNFCLDDHSEKKWIFLYGKPPLPPAIDLDESPLLSHRDHQIE